MQVAATIAGSATASQTMPVIERIRGASDGQAMRRPIALAIQIPAHDRIQLLPPRQFRYIPRVAGSIPLRLLLLQRARSAIFARMPSRRSVTGMWTFLSSGDSRSGLKDESLSSVLRLSTFSIL